MNDPTQDRPSPKTFNPDADRNGQDLGLSSPLDIGVPARTQEHLKGDPGGEAETARIASGRPGEDATDQTAAETPAENLRRIGDPRPGPRGTERSDEFGEAIERATAVVGKDEAEERDD